MTLRSETRLGPYEIVSAIGAGGMGEVYRARDPRLGRDVAIKVLPASFSGDPSRLQRFEQEARAAAALNHPNILAVHDIGTQDGSPYIVSELLDGATLRERLRTGPLPVRKAIDYAQQIARGLAAAHDKGIVHRDLKPENIFVTNDGRVKILDFGLVKLTHSEAVADDRTLTQGVASDPGTVLGTAGYMSPEQVRGKPADARSDLFSFGAILYEMLSGKRAFHGESAAETMSAIAKEEPPELTESNRNVPPALERVVRHCLEKNPAERFQSARDVAFALESLSDTSSATKAVVEPVHRRARVLALAIAGVSLLAIGFITGSRLAGSRSSEPVFYRASYRRGTIYGARFTPDGKTILYSAEWDGGPMQLFSVQEQHPESGAIPLPRSCLLSISAQGELALVVNPTILAHQECRGTLARAVTAGGAPREILEDVDWADWAKDGNSLAVIHHVGGKSRLEFPVGRVLCETGGYLSHPRISPDGKRIAFLDHPVWPDDRGTVAVVDLAGKKTALSREYVSEDGLAWSPAGNEVWFTASDSGNARSLRAASLDGKVRLISRIPGTARLQDISPDGRVLFTRDEQSNGIVVSTPGNAQERDLSWMDWSLVKDISPDGKWILFDEQGDGGGELYSTYIRRTDGSPPVRLGDGGAYAISGDGKWVVAGLPKSPQQLILLPTGAGEPHLVEGSGLVEYSSADFFPDGKRLLVCGNELGRAQHCFVQPLAGGPMRAVTPEGVLVWPGGAHAISPDGNSIAAVDGQGQPYIYPVSGGDGKPIPGTTPGDIPERWTADGHSIFVFRRREFPTKVYRLDVASGKREVWKTLTVPDPTGLASIGWIQPTPDGNSYAFTYSRSLSQLYIGDGLR